MKFFDYLSNFNVHPVFILVMITLFSYCLIRLLADLFNRVETIEYGDFKITTRSINKVNMNEFNNIIKIEDERKQKEAWFNQKIGMEFKLNNKLALARVWKRSSTEGYLTNTQKNGAIKAANDYNEMLIKYTSFCKSINEKPNSELKYIIDIYNKGKDFVYGEEPKFYEML